MILRKNYPWKKNYDQLWQPIKKQRHYFASKGPSSQSYGFPSSHVWMWDWTIKKAEYWKLDAFELDAFGAGEDSWESLRLQGDQTNQY